MTRTRLSAAAAGTAVAAGAFVMLATLVAAPGPWTRGYVSEAGTSGQPYAVAYRWGLIVLGLGVALLGIALLSRARATGPAHVPDRASARLWQRPAVRSGLVAGVLLLPAAVLASISGAVACSNQCPLPPYEPTTLADVIHTAASIVGMVLLAGAMVAVCLAGLRPAARRLSVVAAALTVPLGGALGLTMLFAGRGQLGATLERMLLVVSVSWLVGTSLLIVTGRGAADPGGGVAASAGRAGAR